MSKRSCGWIQTYSGNKFWPTNPRVGDFVIEDIAHALSNLCRFAGHCEAFYSVAQHSVLVSRACEANRDNDFCHTHDPMEGLLHDAAEAYLVDMPRPVKHSTKLAGYRLLEIQLEETLAAQFGLIYPWPESVRKADDIVLVTEKRDLMKPAPTTWGKRLESLKPLPQIIKPWSPRVAKQRFLDRFHDLQSVLWSDKEIVTAHYRSSDLKYAFADREHRLLIDGKVRAIGNTEPSMWWAARQGLSSGSLGSV